MKNMYWIILGALLLTACSATATEPALQTPPPLPTHEIVPTQTTDSPPETPLSDRAQPDDFFTQMSITLPAPVCSGLTPPQAEGPYYTPDTPQKNSFLEDDPDGTRLILVGRVLDQNCQPLPNAWLDFWQ
ncbi:MAG TPA: hypothetical protein VK851_13940, partial [Anaerolineales bacterium]|nr:hypothetical protein [Anaerolineales bacterium]